MIADYFYVFLIFWMGLALASFVTLFFIPAPYGRHAQTMWKPYINGTLGWIMMEFPAVFTFALFYLISHRVTNFYSILFLLLWEMHYLHRSFIFAFRRQTTAKSLSLYVVLLGICFNTINGSINSYWINILSPGYSKEWMFDPFFIIGICLFFIGFSINIQADEKLLKLRKQGDVQYKIPQGWLYKYISCPNYLGEIIEWVGYALATWSPAAFAFALWTMANLIPRAMSHHAWYQHYFDDYPKDRKAIFPFLL